MRYRGKLAGFILALLSGAGLWAILLGLLTGHLFDKYRQRRTGSQFSRQQRQQLIFTTTFEIMGHVAKAKGRVTQANIDMATQIMERMNLHGNVRQAAQDAYRSGKAAHYPLRSKLRQLRHACFGQFELIRLFLEIQIEAAFANGVLHPREQHLLYLISDELGISRRQLGWYLQNRNWFSQQHHRQKQQNSYQHNHSHQSYHHKNHHQQNNQQQHRQQYHRQQYQSSAASDANARLHAACKVLGVELNYDATTIKRAYRKLMSQHHPDKLVSQGLPPAMMKLAKQRTQQIQQAYDIIKLAKGFK